MAYHFVFVWLRLNFKVSCVITENAGQFKLSHVAGTTQANSMFLNHNSIFVTNRDYVEHRNRPSSLILEKRYEKSQVQFGLRVRLESCFGEQAVIHCLCVATEPGPFESI